MSTRHYFSCLIAQNLTPRLHDHINQPLFIEYRQNFFAILQVQVENHTITVFHIGYSALFISIYIGTKQSLKNTGTFSRFITVALNNQSSVRTIRV